MKLAGAIVLMTAAAVAAEEYDTGFEMPDFGTGFIGGQSGWSTFDNNQSQPHISDLNPFDGTQHLRIGKDDALQNGDPVGAFSPIVAQTPGGNTLASLMLNISATGGASYEVAAQSVSEDSLTGLVQFFWADFDGDGANGDILVLDGGDYVDTGYDYVAGEYRQLRIEAFGSDDALDYYYDEELIYSTTLAQGGTVIEQLVLMSDNFQSGDHADFDNVAIVPAPGSLALLGAATLMWRRRR